MSNAIIDVPTNAPSAPWKVDAGRGSMRADVSRQWFSRPDDERYLSLDDLYAATRARYESSQEARVETRSLDFITPDPSTGDYQSMTYGLPGGAEVAPTHWSFGQTAALASAPASYMRTLPSPLAADCLRYGMLSRNVELVKAYTHEDQLRALTGPDYGRVYDWQVVDAVRQLADRLGWKVPGVMDWSTSRYNPHVDVTKESTTLFASDRDVFCFLVDDQHPIEIGKLPDGSPDLVFRGIMVANSETGAKTLWVAAFYLRGVCMNRCIWGVEGFQEISIRHSKSAPVRFLQEAAPAIQAFGNRSSERLLEGVEMARAARIAEDDDGVREFMARRKFTQAQIASSMAAHLEEEGRPIRNVWDAAQGVTALARKTGHQDARVMLERQASKLLDKVA